MSLKKYMWIDLGMLAFIGFTMEMLGNYIVNTLLYSTIVTSVVSLLIVFVAIARWDWKGLVIIPIVAVGTIIAGRFMNPKVNYRVNYDWRLYLAILCQLLSLSINILWYRKIKDELQTSKKLLNLFGLCTIDAVISLLVLTIAYLIYDRKFYLSAFLAWDAMGYAVLFIGAVILSRQGVILNIKKKILLQKQEIEEENKFQMKLDEEEKECFEQKEGDFRNGQDS